MSHESNRRRHPRVVIPPDAPALEVQLQGPDGRSRETRVVRGWDISRTGMAFSSARPIRVGTRCVALLQQPREALRVIGKVTNCRLAGTGGAGTSGGTGAPGAGPLHIVGVKFTSVIRLPRQPEPGPLCRDPVMEQLTVDL